SAIPGNDRALVDCRHGGLWMRDRDRDVRGGFSCDRKCRYRIRSLCDRVASIHWAVVCFSPAAAKISGSAQLASLKVLASATRSSRADTDELAEHNRADRSRQ